MEDQDKKVVDMMLETQTLLLAAQNHTINHINLLWESISEIGKFEVKATKIINNQSKKVTLGVLVSICAITYMGVTTKLLMRQEKKLDGLNNEVFNIRKKMKNVEASCHADSRQEQEGK